jgi:hypothetical protein
MRFALTRGPTNAAATSAGSGWFLRMRMWFATLPVGRATATAPVAVASPDVQPVQGAQSTSSHVLSFPYRGNALLVKLADILKKRIAEAPTHADRFVLSLTRAPRLRLVIDETAYVEFDAVRAAFSMVVEVEPCTQLTLDTEDFDTLVRFVVQYVRDKLAEPFEPEDAA